MSNNDDAYCLELQVAMLQCELAGDIEGAEHYRAMIDDYLAYSGEITLAPYGL